MKRNKKILLIISLIPICYALFALANDLFALNLLNTVSVVFDKISYGYSLVYGLVLIKNKYTNQNNQVNSHQPQELGNKSRSCEVEKDGFSPTETSALTNVGVEDQQLKSSLSPDDTLQNKGEKEK